MQRELASIGVRGPISLGQVGWNFVKTVWDPTRSDIAHGITGLAKGALGAMSPARLRAFEERNAAVTALYREGYDPPLDTERLARLPGGTLGREYARFIQAHGLDPLATLLAIGTPTNAFHYNLRRAYKLHDILHVVLGCDPSVLGEVRIVSWSIGQALHAGGPAMRAPAMALSVLLLHLAIRRPDEVAELVQLSHPWLERGASSPNHVAFRFEDHFESKVEDVRALFEASAAA